jgi:hypothetical protein
MCFASMADGDLVVYQYSVPGVARHPALIPLDHPESEPLASRGGPTG